MPLLSPTRPRPARPTLTTDVDHLRDLAERLNGRPVPGVRMTERQFVDWGTPGALPAEWVNGEIYLMGSPSVMHARLTGWLFPVPDGLRCPPRFGRGVRAVDRSAGGGERPPRPRPAVRRPSRGYTCCGRTTWKGRRTWPWRSSRRTACRGTGRPSTPSTRRRGCGNTGSSTRSPGGSRRTPWSASSTGCCRRSDDGRVHSKLLKGLHVRPAWLWRSPLPRVSAVLKEVGVR